MEVFNFLSKMLWKHPLTQKYERKEVNTTFWGKGVGAGINYDFQQILSSFYEPSSENA